MPALRIRPRGGKSYEVVEDRKEDENMEASEKAMLKEVVKPNVDTEARWVNILWNPLPTTYTEHQGLLCQIVSDKGKIRR